MLLQAALIILITVILELLTHYAARDHLGPRFEELDVWWREAIGVFWLLTPASVWVYFYRPDGTVVLATVWTAAVVTGMLLKLIELSRTRRALEAERRALEALRGEGSPG